MADLAQLVRALVCGTRCREFESHNPPHNKNIPHNKNSSREGSFFCIEVFYSREGADSDLPFGGKSA